MKTTKKSIETFLATRRIAVAGVSRTPKKFGYEVFKELRNKGFEVLPVNPLADVIEGVACYSRISDLPPDVESLLIVTPKKETRTIFAEALERKIPNVWIQQMSETPESIELAAGKQVNLISKQCILMHLEPVEGFHKFHRGIMRFFGLLPK